MKTSDKNLNKLLKELDNQGWRVRKGKHLVCYAPDGENIVTISSSANSDSLNKVRKQLTMAGARL